MSITHRRQHPVLVALLVALTIAAVACGDDSEPVSTGPGADPDGQDGEASDTPILVIDNEGAFTTREVAFSRVPQIVVYSDGRVLQRGAQIMIFPGPALPAVFESQLTDEGLDTLVETMRESNLARADVDYGTTNIADAGDTVVTVRIDGTEYTHRAQALGAGGGAILEAPDEDANLSLTEEQREARAMLEGFVNEATDLTELVGPDEVSTEEAYEPDRYRLWVRPASEVDVPDEGTAGDDVAPDEVEWTIDAVDLVAAECLAVEGDAATELTVLLSGANQLTQFVDDEGTAWSVVARPVLPHEPTCPDA